jgi:hypothetical protein
MGGSIEITRVKFAQWDPAVSDILIALETPDPVYGPGLTLRMDSSVASELANRIVERISRSPQKE